MEYLKFNLSDNTPVKFKIVKAFNPRYREDDLKIVWKYDSFWNCEQHDIWLNECIWNMPRTIEYLQQITDEEFINQHRIFIEEEHEKIKNIKRYI